MTNKQLAEKHGISKQAASQSIKRHGSIEAADSALEMSSGRSDRLKGKAAADFNEVRTRKTKAEAELAELKLAREKGEVVEVSRVLKSMEENAARVRAMCDAAFRSELPAKQGGMPSDQIAAMNGARLDEIYKELSKI